VPIEIPESLKPTLRTLPPAVIKKMDRILTRLMKDPFPADLSIQELELAPGFIVYAILIDGYRLIYRPLHDTNIIALCGIGKIE
jgi:mRNA-degrading endonuclease RelE of RelBE toxin-antitoxin system